ncbi:unnamed protein product [Mytilus edulis]|uniref:Uncharacterized protein n=1 Tax=Mytilus edulis TaxID=6550 RepID=A0A8S3RP18_MYTED|nr:unnamed protein product [Mytilus edulis]
MTRLVIFKTWIVAINTPPTATGWIWKARMHYINRTEDLNNAVEYEATAAVIPTTIVGTVTEIKITQSYMCKSCTRKLPEIITEEKYNRCTFCKMLQKTDNFVSCLTATLNVESEDELEDNQPSKLTIFNSQINNFCTLHFKEELLKDHLKMEEFFLEETFAFNHFCTKFLKKA